VNAGSFGGTSRTGDALTVNTARGYGPVYWPLTLKHPRLQELAFILAAVYLILLKRALMCALALLFSCFYHPLSGHLVPAWNLCGGIVAADLRIIPIEWARSWNASG